ncbi:MAG: nitroreductase [Epulopiscium sp. Nele67-Bin002]|nr:MAG: nitroreductase [Epulopiscium sp. Nele67-Bin002]OON94612.1 MAG: nitroreductase [Epulopiscium sp. Nele67-Bin001]
MNILFTRRSVRSFTDEAVSEAQVEQLLKAAMQAPSARNQQCWEFIVVTKKDDLVKLSQTHSGAKPIENAPVCIIVLGNKERMVMPDRWEQDLGAVTQNILLQATELGLGSVWCGIAPAEDRMDLVKNMYGLNDNLLVYCTIAIGHPKNSDALKFVDRYDASRVTYVK